MSISLDPEELFTEIRAAEALRKSRLHNFSRQTARFHGPFYRDDHPDEEWFPENHYYEFSSITVPQLIYDNPRVAVTSKRGRTHRQIARAMEFGLNRWIKDTQIEEVLTEVAQDLLFNWGVVMVCNEPMPDVEAQDRYRMRLDPMEFTPVDTPLPSKEKERRRPAAYRISQRNFILDPLARNVRDARYQGHEFIRSRSGCITEARENPDSGWNLQLLLDLDWNENTARHGHGDYDQTRHEDHADYLGRDEIKGWEIWIPEITLEGSKGPKEGYYGTLCTITTWETEEGNWKAEHLREPRPFYGPPTGPYVVFGVYNVPDEPYPLSPMVAVEANIVSLNRKVLAANRADIEYKRLVLYDETDVDAAEAMNDTPDGYFCGIANLDSARVKEVQIGGSTPEQHAGIAVDRDRLDRNSGLTDAQRGNISGSATATENAIADQASVTRHGFIKKKFARRTQDVLEKVAWYLWNDERIAFPLGEEAERELQKIDPYAVDPWFEGGFKQSKDYPDAVFTDLELRIEPFSMERSDQGSYAAKRVQGFEMVMQAAPIALATPFINWPRVFSALGEAINWPELSDLIDMQALAKTIEMQQEASGAPRLSGDVGTGLRPLSGSGSATGGDGFRQPRAHIPQNQRLAQAAGRAGGGAAAQPMTAGAGL